MEESISGFKRRGDWGDVVEHGERLTRALREVLRERGDEGSIPDHHRAAFDEWEDWRPKHEERIDEDVSEKTAQQASVREGEGEQAGKEPDEDLQTAGEKLGEAYDALDADDTEGAVDKWGESVTYVARAADSAGRKALRAVENTVYQRVMTQLAPYYFDNELVSANLQRTTRGVGAEQFIFEVNVNEDALKEAVSDRLADFEDTVDRWHVTTPKETTQIEAAEGVEPPEEDETSRSTRT